MDPLPPNSSTQQYGGATWWRPSVLRADDGTYHGFFVYNSDPNPSHKFPNVLILHYTSTDLQAWTYVSVVRRHPPAYDSTVFRIADGRWIMFSTMQDRTAACHPLQSHDLYNWTNCTDAALQINVGEGPHVTGARLNHADAHPWNGFAWLNYEGGYVWRSSDGGLTWTQQAENLFRGGGVKYLDVGAAHQGPLLAQTDGTMYVLYFCEFSTSPVGLEKQQVRSAGATLRVGVTLMRSQPDTVNTNTGAQRRDHPNVLR